MRRERDKGEKGDAKIERIKKGGGGSNDLIDWFYRVNVRIVRSSPTVRRDDPSGDHRASRRKLALARSEETVGSYDASRGGGWVEVDGPEDGDARAAGAGVVRAGVRPGAKLN